jgi:hypothetical protein
VWLYTYRKRKVRTKSQSRFFMDENVRRTPVLQKISNWFTKYSKESIN